MIFGHRLFDFIEKTTAFEREGFLKFQSKYGKQAFCRVQDRELFVFTRKECPH